MAGLVRQLSLLGGLALVALMLLTVVDVTLRAAFSRPIFGVTEVTELGLILVTVLGIAHCGFTGAHIAIDFLELLLPRAALRVSDAGVRVAGAALMGAIAWRSVVEALDADDRGAHSNLLHIPQMPFYLVVALGFALYGAVLLVQAVRPPPAGRAAGSHE